MSREVPFASRFGGPERSPGFLLWQLSMSWQRRQREALKELKLTHVQFVLLAAVAWLSRQGEPATQAAIASHARTDVMMTSQVLRALESRKLLERTPHPTDTRAKAVRVTPAGQALVKRAVQCVEAVDEAFFSSIGKDRESFVEAMRTLIAGNESP